MNITVSDCVALAALVVSILSMRYSKKQIQQARISAHNDYRSHLAEQHAPYRKALKEIRTRHKEQISHLSQLAGRTLTDVVHQFDEYDIKHHTPRYLRHLLDESAGMVFLAFRQQLAWQTAENLTWRLAAFIHIEENLNPRDNPSGDKGFSGLTQQKTLATPDHFPESYLKNDTYFCNLIAELKSRIAPERKAELLLTLQHSIAPLRAELARLRPQFEASAAALEELIAEGVTEHFSLNESAELCQAMNKYRTILKTLSQLHFETVSEKYADKYTNAVSVSLHTCAVLHMIQGVSMWGVEVQNGNDHRGTD